MAELQYKCPCCGGAVEFNAGAQKIKCPYCDTEFDMDALKDFDEARQQESADEMKWETSSGPEWTEGETAGLRVYVCKSCGGEIVADENTGATTCPYCDNPVVMTGRFSGALKPEFVIPFKLDKAAARKKYLDYVSGKRLLPKTFRDMNHIDEMKGVYVPFWLFDTKSEGDAHFQATRVRRWSDDRYDYKETSYYAVYRAGKLAFEKVPVDGASKIDDTLMESVEPFDFGDAVPFQTAYLAGYMADKYDVDAQASEGRANDRVKRSTEAQLESTVTGFDTVSLESSSIRLKDGRAHYVLYPVWFLNTTWDGGKYTFAMNGQTGKFVGNLPCDKKAFVRLMLLVGAAAAVVIFIILFIIMRTHS